jgi:16S rRNA (guanine966-N2)-methyltransferase
MTDRIKESLFSALGDVTGVSVLDLYAGSGSLGIEALSRGAARATFVESAHEAILKLEENVEATGFKSQSEIFWAEVSPTISKDATERVDLIFLDPPYSTGQQLVRADLEALVMGGFLADEGRVVLHRPAKERRHHPLGLECIWDREYGQSALYVFTHEEEDEEET